MKIRLLKANRIRDLFVQVENNLDLYRKGTFDYIMSDPTSYFEIEHEIDEEKLIAVSCSEKDHREVANCRTILEAMRTLTPYLARDERIWVYLTHKDLLDYSRRRWPIPDDDGKAITHIRNHFFVVGARGFERDNAVSRLWWMAYICDRVKDLTIDEALECLLFQYDVRASIIERPTTSQSIHVFSAILKKLNESYKKDKKLFQREIFRDVMKQLNLSGGVKLLGVMDQHKIEKILEEFI